MTILQYGRLVKHSHRHDSTRQSGAFTLQAHNLLLHSAAWRPHQLARVLLHGTVKAEGRLIPTVVHAQSDVRIIMCDRGRRMRPTLVGSWGYCIARAADVIKKPLGLGRGARCVECTLAKSIAKSRQSREYSSASTLHEPSFCRGHDAGAPTAHHGAWLTAHAAPVVQPTAVIWRAPLTPFIWRGSRAPSVSRAGQRAPCQSNRAPS
jgi:hypothetical protein